MGNKTNVGVVALGGAISFVLLYSAQLIASIVAERDLQFPTGLESAMGTIIIALLCLVMPADALTKIRKRSSEEDTEPPK